MARHKSRNTASTRKRKGKKHLQTPLLSQISPQRWKEIFAISLIVIGLLTLISLFTQTTDSITEWWITTLSVIMGWGVFVFPIFLITIGGWFLLQNLKPVPSQTAERVIGTLLLFINLLAWFHFVINGSLQEAHMGAGGGIIGAGVKLGFVATLGRPGAAIALSAWLLISLILTLDIAMLNILKWAGAFFAYLYAKIKWIIKILLDRFFSKKKSQATIKHRPSSPSQHTGNPANQLQDQKVKSIGAEDTLPANTSSLYYNQMPEEPVWVLPDIDKILNPEIEAPDNEENDRQRARVIEETLRSFGAPARVVDIRSGPTITLFGVEPDFIRSRNGKTRVRVSKITALSDDIALALAAARIRIQAPVPGKGYIGIEVPNRQVALVSLREVIVSSAYNNLNSPLKIILGKDVSGKAVAADLTAMPHLLIAGTTGAGKSVCINGILSCLLLNMTPDDLRLILVDPKRVELSGYNGIPHLLSPVIVEAEHVVGSLKWMMREMDIRYRKFSDTGTRNIVDYNTYCANSGLKKLPYLLVVIDELADLMMLAPDETERTITRLAQLARATGIHLILATQRPSTDILTGLIKANFPARIAFAVASSVDSRVILDQPGADRLLGRGDMLFQAPDAPAPVRIQSAFVSDVEINRLTAYWRGFTVSPGAPERPNQPAAFQTNKRIPLKQAPLWEEMEEDKNLDPKFDEAVEIIREEGTASISMLQRKMRIGYTRAARIVDMMEEKGIISEPDPKTQIRQVLIADKQQTE